MSRIVFVGHELAPGVPGGAGAVLEVLTGDLAAAGHDVTVVLASDPGVPAPPGVEVVTVHPPRMDGTIESFVERSRRLAAALADVATDRPDRVEFHDFDVPGWWALTHRQELGLAAVPLLVRLHGPVDAMTEAMGVAPPPMDRIGVLERQAFGMADGVIVPSASVGRWAIERYALDEARVVVGPPPVPAVTPVVWEPGQAPEFVAFGRLHEVKGTHDLVVAAIPVLDRHPGATLRLIGADGWSASARRPMSELLAELVPDRLQDRVVLTGPLPRAEALSRMRTAWAVVVPSRFESFCAAAHEARRAGLPVVAPDLPAFDGMLSGHGILGYDGSVAGLTDALESIATDVDVSRRLVSEPVPIVGDSLRVYESPTPPIRHERTQAGLATAAVKEYESWAERPVGRLQRTARRLVRAVPRPVASLAMRVLPARLKDRVRVVVSWPEEEQRRRHAERLAAVEAKVRRGVIDDVDDPLVSIVIPCFEQGEWVRDAVTSVFEQTATSWEIVLVDDGSAEPATISTLDELGEWPRIELVRQPNRGLSAARNAGVAASRGRFVVPLDADDEIAPTFLEAMTDALSADPSAAYAHCLARLFGDVDSVWIPRPENPYWLRLSNGVVGCVLLRREAFDAVGGYDESMRSGHEDWDMWVRLAAAGWGSARVDEPLFRYRKHGVSMSVASEASFETARAGMAVRHPDLYDRSTLTALKQHHYPLLSVIVGDGDRIEPSSDVQPVPRRGALEDAVALCRGKYVVDLEGRVEHLTHIIELADELEHHPAAAGGTTRDGVAVWRRWCLLDPAAEPRGWVGDRVEGRLAAGRFPDAAWLLPSLDSGLTVTRQRPEEAGRIPEDLLS